MGIITVKEITSKNLDHEDGSKIYHIVKEHIRKNEKATIDFSGIDIVTSSFLNTSFRLLAVDYDYETLKNFIEIKNSTKSINWMIKDYLVTSYKHPIK